MGKAGKLPSFSDSLSFCLKKSCFPEKISIIYPYSGASAITLKKTRYELKIKIFTWKHKSVTFVKKKSLK